MQVRASFGESVGMKEWYGKRKETIERVFGTAKEFQGCATLAIPAKP